MLLLFTEWNWGFLLGIGISIESIWCILLKCWKIRNRIIPNKNRHFSEAISQKCQNLFLSKVVGLSLEFYLKRDSCTGVFLWILWNFWEHVYYRTPLLAASDFLCTQYCPHLRQAKEIRNGSCILMILLLRNIAWIDM